LALNHYLDVLLGRLANIDVVLCQAEPATSVDNILGDYYSKNAKKDTEISVEMCQMQHFCFGYFSLFFFKFKREAFPLLTLRYLNKSGVTNLMCREYAIAVVVREAAKVILNDARQLPHDLCRAEVLLEQVLDKFLHKM
jgi:hypothetical protein